MQDTYCERKFIAKVLDSFIVKDCYCDTLVLTLHLIGCGEGKIYLLHEKIPCDLGIYYDFFDMLNRAEFSWNSVEDFIGMFIEVDVDDDLEGIYPPNLQYLKILNAPVSCEV